MSGRGSTGQKISSTTTWAASSFLRYSHSSRTSGLSSMRTARWTVLNVRTSEESGNEFMLYHYRCILSTNPCCVRARFRVTIGLPISDLSHRLGQPAMASICKPRTFFEHPVRFFRWKPIFLGLFESGIWREQGFGRGERDAAIGPPGDRDNPQRLLTIRDGGFIGTPTPSSLYGPSLDARSRGRRRNRNRFAFKPSSRLIPRIIFRVSLSQVVFSDPSRACGS
jgi:hypothetical protein